MPTSPRSLQPCLSTKRWAWCEYLRFTLPLTKFLLTLIRCSNKDLARKYFKQATNWMPSEEEPLKKHSGPFDYNSIMIYDSATGRTLDTVGFPLTTKDGEFIHIGGDADPEQAGISDQDIERVVELYTAESADSHSTPQELPSTPEKSDSMPEGSGLIPEQSPWKAITKRWWSVQQDHDAHSNDPQPWPVSDDGSHTITYCFDTDAVFAQVGSIFTRALAKWAVAIHASSLQFLPDTVCDQQARVPCICRTPGMADETLRIIQAPQDQRLNYAESTLGFRTHNFPIPNGRPRHFMMWPANANFFGDPSRGGLVMAHELGT